MSLQAYREAARPAPIDVSGMGEVHRRPLPENATRSSLGLETVRNLASVRQTEQNRLSPTGESRTMAKLEATYAFGDVRFAAASEIVSRSVMPVSLEPKAFELLVYFIQHRGRLLEKQEILDAVWGTEPSSARTR